MSGESFDLERFVRAQAPVYETALAELRAGRKLTHWMWFIFPQLKGLGHSPTAQFFGLLSRAEADAFLRHDILGQRLIDCTAAVIAADAPSLHAIFGSPDDIKFKSSMTLFSLVAPDQVFDEALRRWCAGEKDAATLKLLGSSV